MKESFDSGVDFLKKKYDLHNIPEVVVADVAAPLVRVLRSQPASFLSRYAGRVLSCELSAPTAEHPADLVERLGERRVLLGVERFRFP